MPQRLFIISSQQSVDDSGGEGITSTYRTHDLTLKGPATVEAISEQAGRPLPALGKHNVGDPKPIL